MNQLHYFFNWRGRRGLKDMIEWRWNSVTYFNTNSRDLQSISPTFYEQCLFNRFTHFSGLWERSGAGNYFWLVGLIGIKNGQFIVISVLYSLVFWSDIIHILKYERLLTSGCNDKGLESEFVASVHFLCTFPKTVVKLNSRFRLQIF